jgi:F-type H+-transporting ATPase subunit gamma
MAVNTKAIQSRISSVKSTKKITKAMEMISAVKMRKATANVLATRDYASLAWQILADIAQKTDINLHPLLRKNNESHKIGVILITGNRGLAGGFTSRLLSEIHQSFKNIKQENQTIEMLVLGKKGRKIHQQFGYNILADFLKIDLTTKIEEIRPLSQMAINDYIAKKFDAIYLAFMDFESAVIQTPRIKRLLPLTEIADEHLGQTNKTKEENEISKNKFEFKFEPNPEETLKALLPRLVEMQIYQAILESDASEHSARMVSMKNASEAAEDMIAELQHSFNQARQSAITREISEIVGGAAALSG